MSSKMWIITLLLFGLFTLAIGTPTYAETKDKPNTNMPKEQDGPSEPTGPITYPQQGENPVIQYHILCNLIAYTPELRDGIIRAFGEQTCNVYNRQYITVCLYNSRWYGWQQIGCKNGVRDGGSVSATFLGCRRGTYDYQTWVDGVFTDEEGVYDSPYLAKSHTLAGINLLHSHCVA